VFRHNHSRPQQYLSRHRSRPAVCRFGLDVPVPIHTLWRSEVALTRTEEPHPGEEKSQLRLPRVCNDSKVVFIHAFLTENQPILTISVPGGEVKQVAGSADFHSGEPSDYFFGGLTPEDLPLVRPRVGTETYLPWTSIDARERR